MRIAKIYRYFWLSDQAIVDLLFTMREKFADSLFIILYELQPLTMTPLQDVLNESCELLYPRTAIVHYLC